MRTINKKSDNIYNLKLLDTDYKTEEAKGKRISNAHRVAELML